MRLVYLASAIACVAIATPALAQTAFDGTWKVDVASAQLPTKPFGSTLANGVYSCSNCTRPYTVKADGAFHAVAGQPYWDEVSVKVENANTVVQTWKQKGKVTDTVTNTVSADGKTLTWNETDTSAPNGKPLMSSGTNIRVTDGPAGSHATSGTWRPGKVAAIADEVLTVSFKTAGKSVTMTTPAGYHYTATIGGPAVPVVGDTGNTMAALAMPNGNTLVETDTRAGKVVSTMTMVVQSDSKMMAISYRDAERDTTAKYTAMKK